MSAKELLKNFWGLVNTAGLSEPGQVDRVAGFITDAAALPEPELAAAVPGR